MGSRITVADPTQTRSPRPRKGVFRSVLLLPVVPVLGVALVALFLPRHAAHAANHQWSTDAVAASAVYPAVPIITTAAIVALNGKPVSDGAAATLQASAMAAVVGCVHGAASHTVTLFVAGAGNTWKQHVVNAVSGCVNGSATALVPVATMGKYIRTVIKGLLALTPPPAEPLHDCPL